ncbi:MAG: hypothetical protein ABFR63_02540 [Thermodesulfobacteriota bacterium]
MEHDLYTGPRSHFGATSGHPSQVITDDFVESLTELSSFFMPENIVVNPVEYGNEGRQELPLLSNVLLAEICTQQILQCDNRLFVRFNGWIIEGFAKPREFGFMLFHTFSSAKVFPGGDNFQTIELSEFLRLEYPEIRLELTESLFTLNFQEFSTSAEAQPFSNGGGCLLLGDKRVVDLSL